MRAGLLRGSVAQPGLLVGGLTWALCAVALFFGGGSSYAPLVGIGGVALAVAAVALAAVFWGVVPAPRLGVPGWTLVGCLAALVVWMGLSILWSVAPDLSWEYLNRGLAYLAFLTLGLVVAAAVPAAPRLAAYGLALLLAAVMVWALAGKVIPNLFPDGARVARLRDPIDYWNGLALLAAMALPLGLWLALQRDHRRAARVAGVLLLYLAVVALLLTYSRGGLAVALVAVAVFLALSADRIEALAASALAGVPAVLVAAWAFTEPGVSSDSQPYDVRLRDGIQFGVVFLFVAAAVALAAHELIEREGRWRVRFPSLKLSNRRLALIGAVVVVVGVLAASGGNPVDAARDRWSEFTNPTSVAGGGPERIGELNLNSRWTWWEEAWTLFADDPFGGAGAGAFVIARRPIRENTTYALEPHNLALQFLAETGLVGFLLFAGALGGAGVGVVKTVRRLDEREAAAASALAVGVIAYFLHALVDYDWDFVALTAPLMVVLGVLVAAGRRGGGRRRSVLWAVAPLVLVPALLFSLASPWLADRKVRGAFAEIVANDPGDALAAADAARSLNPLSIEPLFATAAVHELRGDERAALSSYVEAAELQPQNFRTWYELGRFELALGYNELGIEHLMRSRELDALGPANDILVTLGL